MPHPPGERGATGTELPGGVKVWLLGKLLKLLKSLVTDPAIPLLRDVCPRTLVCTGHTSQNVKAGHMPIH